MPGTRPAGLVVYVGYERPASSRSRSCNETPENPNKSRRQSSFPKHPEILPVASLHIVCLCLPGPAHRSRCNKKTSRTQSPLGKKKSSEGRHLTADLQRSACFPHGDSGGAHVGAAEH
ncbi:hypothetical protein EYF80_056334 [Liparis tanakae]|uniref:Uncharacterized protein n=1 Tax=Liparis tanakae TaxID=230148 RepID=A0A4Z2EXC0_9TELE|nr:hypothetical protein EYF80_056334 [Liparis tanakae]